MPSLANAFDAGRIFLPSSVERQGYVDSQENSHFSFQFTGKTTYTKRVQFGVPKVMLEPFGM